MGKTQHVGTSADELREATREANEAKKDLLAATREAREAKRALEAMVNDFNASVSEMLKEHRAHISADMGEIAADAVRVIQEQVEEKASELSKLTLKRMRAAGVTPSNLTLRDVLDTGAGNTPHSPKPKSGVDMCINGNDIVQGMPTDTTGMRLTDDSSFPAVGPDDVKRNCSNCKRSCWVSPLQVTAIQKGASLMCMVCTSMLAKLARQTGGRQIQVQGMLIIDADLDRMQDAAEKVAARAAERAKSRD